MAAPILAARGRRLAPVFSHPVIFICSWRTESGRFVTWPMSCSHTEPMPPCGQRLWLLTRVQAAPSVGLTCANAPCLLHCFSATLAGASLPVMAVAHLGSAAANTGRPLLSTLPSLLVSTSVALCHAHLVGSLVVSPVCGLVFALLRLFGEGRTAVDVVVHWLRVGNTEPVCQCTWPVV